jgi:putative transposase
VRGYDGHKHVKGRKRQLIVDSLGLPLRVLLQAANISDKSGGRAALSRLPWTERLTTIRVDQGYDSPALAYWCQTVLGCTLEVSQPAAAQGFVVQKGRWVVERTFAWLGRYRRLSKDYEQSCTMSEAVIYIASIHLLLRRLAR